MHPSIKALLKVLRRGNNVADDELKVNLEHPTIREYVANMTKNGETREKISEIVGIPVAAVEQVQRDLKRQK
jgi:uncharacterized protein YerC